MYKIKEIYYTIQGEGHHTGRPAIFCRFSGCNLWSGREEDRKKAICQFCDTDFWGMDGNNGGKYTGDELAEKCFDLWPDDSHRPFVVFTGGEPLLQLDDRLIKAFKKRNFYCAVETNGTLKAPNELDWICMSPKANTEIVLIKGNEIKIVQPQNDIDPQGFEDLDYHHFYIQPMDNLNAKENLEYCISYCMKNPKWSLSLQTHKLMGID
ncbi:MAG: 7-carboxy-7-deazaguanine synthase [Saprospiraceae bacterium]|nr:7-carboxy-7-deazaguanine synthase [Saprospiraceae bacterium]|tara:strand:+ start:579 stop:1205 length:627 start_codon:yes stop_codon:yes gene_type:complete